MPKIFISPSSQENNIYNNGLASEEVVMNLIADSLIPELVRHNVGYMRNSRTDTYAGHVSKSDAYEPDIHLAIHSNAKGAGTTVPVRGAEVYVYNPLDKTNLGTKLAEILYPRIATLTPATDRGIKKGTMAEVKQVKAPATLIELSYHDDPSDSLWIVSHISEISNALLLSILEVFNIPYKPIVTLPDKKEFLMNEMRKIQVIAMEALR